LKAARRLYGSDRYLLAPGSAAWEWLATLGAAGAVALVYFLAARLGLALLSAPSDVAVFWPGSGIAAGILIVAGRRAYPVLVIGVVAGTVAANVMSDRSLWTSLFKGFCNAGEAVLVAWLLERWFGRPFAFGDLRRIAGFLAAAGLATVASATGGAATMTLLHTTAPYWDVWRAWFLSGGVGVVVVAPIVIGLGEVWREPPSQGQWIEGVGLLALLALAGLYAIGQPSKSWLSFNPGIVVLPPLLWLAARCPPVFAIAGAFAASMMVICATIYGVGRFGDAAVPIMERVRGAQAVVGTGTIFTLALIALFIQRKKAEEELQHREAELAEAQRVARIGSWYWDAQTDVIIGSDELLRIYRFDPATPPADFRAQFDRHHAADDLERLKAAGRRAMETGVGFQLELRAFRNEIPIWVAARGEVVRNGADQIIGLRGTVQDITERKRAEQALAERNLQLALAGRTSLVGSYAYDTDTEMVHVSEGYAAVHGFPEGTTEIARSQWLASVHPEDVELLARRRSQVFRQRQAEYSVDYRVLHPGRGVRWIEARSFISYDGAGQPQRVVGVIIDVTERRQTETRLSDALAAGQVTVFEWDAGTGLSQRSDNAANILGCEQGEITSSSRNDFLRRVHPDDRARLTTHIRELRPDGASYALSFRFVRPDGSQVWLEETAKGEFDAAGKLLRIKGLTRDITARKNAELALAERNAQLALAAKAALVGNYTYDVKTGMLQFSEGYAAIYDLPEGTREMTGDQRRALVHPEDLERLDKVRSQAFEQRRGEFSLEYRNILPKRGVRWIESRSLIFYDSDGRPQRLVGVNIDITERKRAEETQRLLIGELDHRVKNVLATVSAVVSHTGEGSRSVANFIAALEGRIRSMATTHELLSAGRWQGISLTELVRRELAPFATRNNVEINGPEVLLKSEAGQAMAMVLHELATNAAKYGALSSKNGRVSVRWDRRSNGHARSQLVLEWQETGGPPVIAPGTPSYGTSSIRDLIPYEFGGTVDLVLAREGVRCRLELPADWLSNDAEPAPGEGTRAPSQGPDAQSCRRLPTL
jgi:PAS domain S-box-containing protein